ncbi:MAG TPA: hypothetical protein VF950_13245 [Planctomycetota bacterium]
MRILAALALLLPQAAGAPDEEYKAKLSALSKSAAAKHFQIGDYLSGATMHLWAREQFYKAIENDPDHEGARKKLGFKKSDEGKWESDPTIKQEFANKKKDSDADKVRKAYSDKLELAGKDLGRQWADLALWCRRGKLEAESAEAFRKALEYDPGNATARKELGYEKTPKGAWISKFERELRKEMRDGITKAPAGAASEGETDVEKGLGQKHRKKETGHFRLESPHLTEPQISGLLQHSEHAYAMFHKIFKQEDLLGGRRVNWCVLKDKAQYVRFVDVFHKAASPAHKELTLRCRATGGGGAQVIYQDNDPIPLLEDWVVHYTTQMLIGAWTKSEYCWLQEGLAFHFTRLMKDTALLHCVDLAGTSPENKGKNYTQPEDWPIVCKVWVRDGKDPDINAIVKCTNFAELDGAEAVKSWSLVEFLLAEHRDKFIAFCKELSGDKDLETALKTAWGWSTSDLDQRWKQYVKMAY